MIRDRTNWGTLMEEPKPNPTGEQSAVASSASAENLEQHEASPIERLLARVLDRLTEERPKKKSWFEQLSCPFVVTVLGGMLGSGLTFVWQACEKQREEGVAHRNAIEARRLERYNTNKQLMSSFANEFPAAHDRLYSVIEQDVRAHAAGARAKQAKDRGAREAATSRHAEEVKRFYGLDEKYLSGKNAGVFFVEIKANFGSEKVIAAANELNDQLNQMLELGDSPSTQPADDDVDKFEKSRLNELRALRKKINKAYENLIVAMGTELKDQTAREEKE